jgi:hypothetical protein
MEQRANQLQHLKYINKTQTTKRKGEHRPKPSPTRKAT